MNVKRFTARNSREALRLVREALGDDAIVLSTKPRRDRRRGDGDGARQPRPPRGDGDAEHGAGSRAPRRRRAARAPPSSAATSAEQDADRLSMSTLSFQDYVRKRMLKRRQASREAASGAMPAPAAADRRGADAGRDA